ncbi:MAG: hypothetical protein K8T90_12260 [Planctomycetes bacterium]|nr:hypothetical protein [Planctomycetota bacterium]
MTRLGAPGRCAAAAAALAVASLLAGPRAEAEPKSPVAAFLAGVSVRHGVAHGSLVVLPIVLDLDPAAAPGGKAAKADDPPLLVAAGAGTGWHPAAGRESIVELSAGPAPAERERFLPTGTILSGGAREWMLTRPVALSSGEAAAASASVCDARTAPAAPDALPRPQAMAPLEQRKLSLLGNGEAVLTVVQKIQAAIAHAPEGSETVEQVLATKFVTDGVAERWADLARLPKSYGGLAVGHVAFFGFRPVEVVAYARPADYQALAAVHLRALAESHTFWHDTVGAASPPAADADVKRLVPEGGAVLLSIAKMAPRALRPKAGERARWSLFAGESETDVRPGGGRESFACRFALDDDGRFVHLEAIERSSEPMFPAPYREPGGRPVDERPDNTGGSMTPEALQRLLERLLERKIKRDAAARENR